MRCVRRQDLWLPVLLFFLLMSPTVLWGCAAEETPDAGEAHAETAEGEDTFEEEGEDDDEDEDEGDETDEEAHTVSRLASTQVIITASDDMLLSGQLYDPTVEPSDEGEEEEEDEEDEEESEPLPPMDPKDQYPLVILLHSLNGSHKDWGNLPEKLVHNGYIVFSVDLRGHGKSTRYINGSSKSWRNFKPTDWPMMPKDVNKILRFFEHNDHYRHINTRNVALMGASIGANTALIAASVVPDRIKAIVTLSPGLDYKGLATSIPIVKYPNALFVAASRRDPYAYESSQLLYQWALGPKAIRLYDNIGHGTDMLTYNPELENQIIQWMRKYVPGKTVPHPTPSLHTLPQPKTPAVHAPAPGKSSKAHH